jgi:uncharacterized membrane protein
VNATKPEAETTAPRPPGRRDGLGMMARLRAYFLAGVLVTAPIAVTAYIGWWFIALIDNWVRPLVPEGYLPDTYLPFSIPGLGLIVVVAVLTLFGAFAAGYVGRLMLGYGENLVARMPVVSSVYSVVKQIFETVLAKKSAAFREVVMLEYPRAGVWSLGFITGPAHPEVQRHMTEPSVHVFIPCAPPTAGYLVIVPRRSVTVLDMPVEDGLKLMVSAGIISSADRLTPPVETAKA